MVSRLEVVELMSVWTHALSGEEETYPLSDYAVAMTVDVAQLETISWVRYSGLFFSLS